MLDGFPDLEPATNAPVPAPEPVHKPEPAPADESAPPRRKPLGESRAELRKKAKAKYGKSRAGRFKRTGINQRLDRYCLAVVQGLASAQPGDRNRSLFRASARIASLHTGHGRAPDGWRSRLIEGGIALGLDASECAATVRSGFKAGRNTPKTLKNQSR